MGVDEWPIFVFHLLACNKMDVAFILDSSSSIKGTRWRKLVLPFIESFVKSLSLIGDDGIYIASVTFSTVSEVDFRFNDVTQTLVCSFTRRCTDGHLCCVLLSLFVLMYVLGWSK